MLSGVSSDGQGPATDEETGCCTCNISIRTQKSSCRRRKLQSKIEVVGSLHQNMRLIWKLLRGLHDRLSKQMSPSRSIDPLTVLPTELVQHIFGYLNFRNIVYGSPIRYRSMTDPVRVATVSVSRSSGDSTSPLVHPCGSTPISPKLESAFRRPFCARVSLGQR